MTSSQYAPYVLGYTRATMVKNNGLQTRERELIPKLNLSSDCRLQLACMKMESLVIAGQLHSGELFPGLVHTARHTTGAGYTQNRVSFFKR